MDSHECFANCDDEYVTMNCGCVIIVCMIIRTCGCPDADQVGNTRVTNYRYCGDHDPKKSLLTGDNAKQ